MDKNDKNDTGKNKGGRPLKFQSVKQMQALIDEYFKNCDENEKPYTITGLALALDTDRHTLINYGKKERFFHTIKKAKLRVENYAEERLYSGQMVAGIIFALKNYGWSDKQEINHGGQNGENPIETASKVVLYMPDNSRGDVDESEDTGD